MKLDLAALASTGLPVAALGAISIADVLNESPDTLAEKLGELGVNTALAGGALAPGIGLGGLVGATVGGMRHRAALGMGLGALAGGTAAAVPTALYMLNDSPGQQGQQAQGQNQQPRATR